MTTDESTPSAEGSEDEAPPDPPVEGLATDRETGSTPTDPKVDEVGIPPAGGDPMGGEAPSG
jgi:hypothetical protein